MGAIERVPPRTYVGLIWVADDPAIRLSVQAHSLDEARALVVEQYGEGHVISIWNEEDASRPR
jgi:hypothetical protein